MGIFNLTNSTLLYMDANVERLGELVLGLGTNVVTLLLILILTIMRRNDRCNKRKNYIGKTVLYLIPALGACLSCVDIVVLVRTKLRKDFILCFLPFSRFAMWITVMLSSKFACACCVFTSRILCFWWIFRFLTETLHLNIVFTLQSLECVKEICLIILDIAFGISINVLRIKQTPLKISSLEDPLIEESDDQSHSFMEDETGSWWDLFTFGYIGSIMKHGSLKQLEFENLLPLLPDMDPFTCCENLLRCWQLQECNNSSNPSLIWSISGVYGWPYFRLGLLKVFNDCIGFAGPLFLNRLIKYLEKGSGSSVGYTLAISLGLVSIFKSFLDTQYTFRLSKLKLKLRSSIMSVIYRKCLWVNTANRSGFSEGEIQTFMSVDADRIVNLCNSLHDMWSLPLQIGIALYLLYTQVKFAFLSGLAITILLIPVNKWISVLIVSATEKMMKLKDERMRKTGELLTNIRTLKMYGWDNWFADWLKETRATEVTHLATRKYLDAWCVFFWATTPTLFSLCTFGLFALMGHQLDAATVFTCLALFNSLISPLNSFPWVINGLIDAFISTRRVSKFLCCLEHSKNSSIDSGLIPEDLAVFVEDASCIWSSNIEEEHNLTIKHVSLKVPKGSFVAVIGEVGSGKTSLLNALLGEMQCVHGSIHLNGSVAYVPQVPWILSGTVRENILFGKPFDSTRYFDTLSACTLDVDISNMVGGDKTCIGDKGVNLSGGQRARLALARAIYHGSDMYLLDDVLSAVDSQVGSWILQRALLGPLLNKKSRIMCTHNVQAISCADMIVVMDKGKVKWSGTVTNMPKSVSTTFSLSNEFDMSSPNHLIKRKEPLSVEKEDVDEISEALDIVKLEERKEGRVEVMVYRNYAVFSGWYITIVIFVSAVLMQASRNGNDLWLSYWVDKTGRGVTNYSTSFYLMVLCIFCIINSILTLVRAFSFAFGGLKAAVRIHNALISKLINAPTQFFDQTPSGRILNRFSSDLYTIDDSLPFILNILLANFVGLLGIVVVLSYVQVLFLLLLLPFWYIYSKLQLFYRSTSRELRRLDSVSRSPIYASFTETLDGSSTIRAFNSEEHFVARFIEHLTLYQRTSYSEIIASLWLSLRLQLLGAMVVLFVAVTAVMGSRGNFPISFGTPGLVGLALSYAAPLVSLLGSFLTSFTETEKEMVSVERVLQYMDVPQEEVSGSRQSLSGKWPDQGLVEFHNVTMRYISNLPPALNHISFAIQGGMQVGVIGRTGAGKSSILNALFRLSPVCSGEIMVDGVNINHIPIRELRSRLAVVPQSPFLFQGSLRDNLDPLGLSEDWRIWEILEKCKVKAQVENAGGLDSNLKESGCSFSVGQRQLLCLARALLKSSNILCLDECTANIDVHTASLLHNTISSECKGVTVITIAHRISTVLDLDTILILDRGTLVEQGKPQHLLQDDSSTFSSFVRASK